MQRIARQRVLLVTRVLGSGGGATHRMGLALALLERGWPVGLASRGDPLLRDGQARSAFPFRHDRALAGRARGRRRCRRLRRIPPSHGTG